MKNGSAAVNETDTVLSRISEDNNSPVQIPLAPSENVAFPPPPPPAPVYRRAPQRRAPPRQQQPQQYAPQPHPQNRRPSLSFAFGSNDDVLHVFRLDGTDRVVEMLGREFPRAYLDSLGLDEEGIRTFVLRHVVPDHGGGSYLVRGVSSQGQVLGEAKVKVAGAPQSAQAPTLEAPTSDPRIWAAALNRPGSAPIHGRTIGDAIAEVEGLRAVTKLKEDDKPAIDIDAKV